MGPPQGGQPGILSDNFISAISDILYDHEASSSEWRPTEAEAFDLPGDFAGPGAARQRGAWQSGVGGAQAARRGRRRGAGGGAAREAVQRGGGAAGADQSRANGIIR